jgi:hypothetical protein
MSDNNNSAAIREVISLLSDGDDEINCSPTASVAALAAADLHGTSAPGNATATGSVADHGNQHDYWMDKADCINASGRQDGLY